MLLRTPYGKRWQDDAARWLASWGYATVVQDVRGRGQSGGRYRILADDADDAEDTIDWITRQRWSNGRVGTFGCSNAGENQIFLAAKRHPAHRAMIPLAAGGAIGSARGWSTAFGALDGGATPLSTMMGWYLDWGGTQPPRPGTFDDRMTLARTLPVSGMMRRASVEDAEWKRYVTEPPRAAFWDEVGYLRDVDTVAVPGLHVSSWFDIMVSQTLDLVSLLRENGAAHADAKQQHAIIGPWAHCVLAGSPDSGHLGDLAVTGAAFPYREVYRRWFDFWLRDGRDSSVLRRPRYTFYVFGEHAWSTSEQWPPEWTAPRELFLQAGDGHGRGQLGGTRPRRAGRAEYTYDPAVPIMSRGGTACCTGIAEEVNGAVDQRYLDGRPDIARFASAPLDSSVVIAGRVTAMLYVSSSAADTDFIVKLVDEAPDGTALAFREGIVRARYRNGGPDAEFLEPGTIYEVRVHVGDIAYRVARGHRLRVDVMSSNFPRWDRNLNTTAPRGEGTEWVVARNVIHTGPAHPSRIVFHVVTQPLQHHSEPRGR